MLNAFGGTPPPSGHIARRWASLSLWPRLPPAAALPPEPLGLVLVHALLLLPLPALLSTAEGTREPLLSLHTSSAGLSTRKPPWPGALGPSGSSPPLGLPLQNVSRGFARRFLPAADSELGARAFCFFNLEFDTQSWAPGLLCDALLLVDALSKDHPEWHHSEGI